LISLGALSWSFAIGALAGLLTARKRRGPFLIAVCGGAFVLAAIPIPLAGGLSISGYLRGTAGAPSVTSLVLLGASLLAVAGGSEARMAKEILAVALPTIPAAAFLYPMSLGLTRFDPYVLGYRSHALWLLGVIALGAVASALARRDLLLVSLLGAVAAWRFGLGESTNLWDYLIDPWLSLFAVVWLGRYWRHSARFRRPL
jgi:hypothetical protein